MEIDLTEEQWDYVAKYKKIHDRLVQIEGSIQALSDEAQVLVVELNQLREQENKLFNKED